MKTTFQNKYKSLVEDVADKIYDLIEKKGKESNHRNEKVLHVKEAQQFNLSDGRWLVEMSGTELIDNKGYSCSHDWLRLEQLCEIVDSF